jgi:hypothetical protein
MHFYCTCTLQQLQLVVVCNGIGTRSSLTIDLPPIEVLQALASEPASVHTSCGV